MRIATWNVNSVKQRVPRLLPWLDERRPDVVCLQETKLADDAFADLLGDELADRGYEVAAHGEATWNGVAILSRAGLDDVVRGLAGAPGFPHPEARAVSATCAGIRVVSVYVPNGREPGSEHYEYKLAWMASLRDQVAAISVGHVEGELALDLCYAEDSIARVDLNAVGTATGSIVELQGTAEGEAVPRADMDAMIDLAQVGIASLCTVQREMLAKAGVDITPLLAPRR